MPYCRFETGSKGDVCDYCGYKLKADYPNPPTRVCDGPACRHLGTKRTDNQGVPLTVKCGCSGKEKEIHLPEHECKIHNRCLPTFRPTAEQLEKWNARKPESEIYQLCYNCPDRE